MDSRSLSREHIDSNGPTQDAHIVLPVDQSQRTSTGQMFEQTRKIEDRDHVREIQMRIETRENQFGETSTRRSDIIDQFARRYVREYVKKNFSWKSEKIEWGMIRWNDRRRDSRVMFMRDQIGTEDRLIPTMFRILTWEREDWLFNLWRHSFNVWNRSTTNVSRLICFSLSVSN